MPRRRSLSVVASFTLLLTVAAAAPVAAQFEGCTWERCAARPVPAAAFGPARVAIGADTIALGWRGSAVAERLARASDAAPHATRMRQARTVGLPIAVGAALASPFVLAATLPDERFGTFAGETPSGALLVVPALVGVGAVGTWRADRELQHAIWRHNRQLAIALRAPGRDSVGGAGAACTIERCGLRVRYRGGFGGVRLVQGDHGPQVDLNPWQPGPVAALVRTTPGAEADIARWARASRESSLIGAAALLGSVLYIGLADGSRWQRVLVGGGIAVGGGLIAQPRTREAAQALEDAIWRHNGALAR